MMTTRTVYFLVAVVVLLTSCNNHNSTNNGKMDRTVDKVKRERLVRKYDLLKFPNIKQPILLTVDEFFDGNNDEASIAPNLVAKPPMADYYKILKTLAQDSKTIDAFAEIKEVMVYENGQLNDNEWFYSDMIYFVGDLTKEEIKEATKSLLPDEVDYDTENRIKDLNEKYKDKNVVYVWWD